MSTSNSTVERDNLEKEIAELRAKGPGKLDERIKLRALLKKLDKLDSPVPSSQVFISEDEQRDNAISYVPIELIRSYTNSPMTGELLDRSEMDMSRIEELARSIKKIGLLQPVVLHAMEDGTYRKIAGLRRIEATKLLGQTKIKAIIKYGDFDLHVHNLSILHENTQRDNLNPYERIRAVFHFVKEALGTKDYEDAKKMAIQANNFKKGSVKNPDGHAEYLDIIETVIKETSVFGSLAQFVKHLSIFDMHELIIDNLNGNKLTFKTAEKLHRLKKEKWTNGWSYENVIEHASEDGLSLRDIEEFAAQNTLSHRPEASLEKVLNIAGYVRAKAKMLDENKRKSLEKDLSALYGKYFPE